MNDVSILKSNCILLIITLLLCGILLFSKRLLVDFVAFFQLGTMVIFMTFVTTFCYINVASVNVETVVTVSAFSVAVCSALLFTLSAAIVSALVFSIAVSSYVLFHVLLPIFVIQVIVVSCRLLGQLHL